MPVIYFLQFSIIFSHLPILRGLRTKIPSENLSLGLQREINGVFRALNSILS